MSTWNLGIDDVSEETRAFKDKLASKDGHIAAQQDRIAKQAADLDELKERLNEALHKLTAETKRALRLDADLQQRSEDLRNEKIASENAKAALVGAQEKNRSTALEMRQLESTLERISYTSDEHSSRSAKLEREKSILEARVRELESNLHEVTQPTPTTTPGRRAIARPRSSSLSNFRITTLEQDLLEVRGSLAKKETDLQAASQKLAQVQKDLIKADNEKSATEKKLTAEVEAFKASLLDKEEELAYLRGQQADGSREDELLRRIEEDDAKIAALELMMRGEPSSKELKEKLRRMESQLKEEQRRLAEGEQHRVELIREKEEALDELEDAHRGFQRLAQELQDRDARDQALKAKATKSLETCDDPLMNDDSCLIDMDTLEPCSAEHQPAPPPDPAIHMYINDDAIAQIERLLFAIDRLRGERDSLKRDVQFLESESRFAIEALEAKLSASLSTTSNTHTLATIDQLRMEMDEMNAQFIATNDRNTASLHEKDLQIKSLGMQVLGLAIALGHTTNYAESSGPSQEHLLDLKELGERYYVAILSLEATTNERDDLLIQLQNKDLDWENDVEPVRLAEQDARHHLEEAMHEIAELNNQLEDVESERDALALQVTNLTTDLQIAQDELTNAESRYTNLQFHQLSSMTSNEATRTLREHIEELENRVMRRNELVGILQHDVRRLDTNLRLQEERLGEMTNELEMMAAQKDAMVEDCADAREARDEALSRVEALEEEFENLEGRHSDNQVVITGLIAVVADTVTRARDAVRHARDQTSGAQNHLSAVQQSLNEKIRSLSGQSDEQRDELEKSKLDLTQRQTEVEELSLLAQKLQEEKAKADAELAALREADHDSTISNLQSRNHELEVRLQQIPLAHSTDEDAERDLVQLKLQHAEALGVLQGRLVETESALEELQTRYTSSLDGHQRTQEEAKKSMDDLRQQLEGTLETLSELEQIRDHFTILEKDHAKMLSELRGQLAEASDSHREALDASEALRIEKNQIIADLERLQQSQEALLRSQGDKHVVQQELERKVQLLQGRFEEETRLSEISKEEAARLSLRLQEEVEGRAHDLKAHKVALSSADNRHERAQEAISKLQDDLVERQQALEETQMHLSASEEEKTGLQQEITTLEADVQKSKSLCRYLESQVKDSEHLVTTLRGDIDHLKSDLSRSEKAWKAAEVNLSLQNAQHKRETAEFQRELSAYRSRPNLDHALAELEERNNEMEELLRAKCTEIEENDDRVLEMLKEKKKLSAKVESLNRKVQNLQAKLAAAKASSGALSHPEQQITSQVSVPFTAPFTAQTQQIDQTPQSASATFSRPRSATVAATTTRPPTETPREASRKPSSRVVSGPSSLPRPKTPERNRTITPVFRSRTPERRLATDVDPLPSAVVIGKKRAAPDDFEACENMPVQAFNADGEDVENKTPRVRRVLNSLQSGFTPVRHQSSRPTAAMPSPRRNTVASRSPPNFISDLTNSPYQNIPSTLPSSSAKPSSKRSWLGKIRGSSHQTVDRSAGMRSLFDRGESS
ncbi:hypothetical protein GALMADRAFT_218825 [Galerina marginata CBS 339.88]|uniref:Uncharacterized protein n=1 Tax=Galerina marginata (strain CBS 339.88) TaxID=685588 RepID=A0A067TR80_GALM3|nr:hypothetical protein GALMADRAFT_218825 [Galerina marginata CBS 339.88]